jgi:hypothetical protein
VDAKKSTESIGFCVAQFRELRSNMPYWAVMLADLDGRTSWRLDDACRITIVRKRLSQFGDPSLNVSCAHHGRIATLKFGNAVGSKRINGGITAGFSKKSQRSDSKIVVRRLERITTGAIE